MIKIPIIGLDNSGKTSIVKTFQREFKSLSKIKPTKGVERTKISFMERDIVIWDFGGQEKLREKHLKKAELNFADIEHCFYVIDIQDQGVFNDSIEYFQLIHKELEEFSPDAIINVLINKFDPGMESDPDMVKLSETVGEKFKELAKPFKSNIYISSIFNPISVIHALSKALMGNSIIMENISVIFSDFVQKNNFQDMIEFIIIYSEDYIEIGSYFSQNVNQEYMGALAPEIFSAFDPKKIELNMAEFSLQSGPISIKINKFELSEKKYFLSIGFNQEKIDNQEDIENKAKHLKDEISKIMLYF